MTKLQWSVILLNFIIVLVVFNKSVADKEKTLASGELILLRLAPVDPRSLMQGDYMRLNYDITARMPDLDSLPKRGYCVVTLDSVGVAQLVRTQPTLSPRTAGEYFIAYTRDDWSLDIGANSYFFQEGQSEKFDRAAYGGLRNDREGHSILVGLYDTARVLIQ